MIEIRDTALSSSLASLEAEVLRRPEDGPVLLDPATGCCGAPGTDAREALERPVQLGEGRVLGYLHTGQLEVELPICFGFALSWLAQPVSGKLEGRLALPLEPLWRATVRLALAGPFFCALWREDEERARLIVKPLRQREPNFVRELSVEACYSSDRAHDELLSALLDAHPFTAFEALLEKSGRGRAGEHVMRAFDFWRQSHHAATTALWRALPDTERMAELREWLARIAEASSAAEFAEDLAWAHLRPGGPAEAWIEACAGTLLDGAVEPSRFEQLRQAARATARLLDEPAVLELLRDLARQAGEQVAGAKENAPAPEVRELMASLESSAPGALRNRLIAALTARALTGSPQIPWLDVSVDVCSLPEQWRESLRGRVRVDWTVTVNAPRWYPGVLTHGIERQQLLEVHLPFLARNSWAERLSAVAQASIETTLDGRLVVVERSARVSRGEQDLARDAMHLCGAFITRPAERDTRFRLTWSDTWRLNSHVARSDLASLLATYRFDAALSWLKEIVGEAEQIEAEMSLSLPGADAAAWLEAPVERSLNYKEAYAELSVAVQQALRLWIPFLYFRDLARYDTPATACPLIVYRCTLPFRSKARNEFAYDIMSSESVAIARRSTGMALAAELARIEQLLVAAGKAEQARLYRSSRRETILAGVERAPRLFHSLLVADAVFIDHLIRFGVQAGGLRRALEHEPQRAMRELVKSGEELVKNFQRRLRRLYGNEDFTGLGSLILVEATRGLNVGLRGQARLSGIVRLRAHMHDGRVLESSFVNSDGGQAAAA
jgi:hypothetical protein